MRRRVLFNILSNSALILAVVAISLVSFIPKKQETKTASASRLLAIYEGDRNSNKVSLMINIYWGTEYVEPMLNVLKEKGVKTTFFVGGSWAVENEELLKKIYNDGNEVANHGYNHRDHDKLSDQNNTNEIMGCHNVVKATLGVEMNLFAPPSGAYNDTTIKSATKLGYKTIMWTRDTIDWRDHNTELIINRALNNIKGGDLILMHPTKNTLEALPLIIDSILSLGLTVAPVSSVIS